MSPSGARIGSGSRMFSPMAMRDCPKPCCSWDQLAQMIAIRSVGIAEVERDAVLNDAILFEYLIKHMKRPAGIDHVIFRDDLEPIDHRLALQNVLVMRNAQADPDAVVGMSIESISWHEKLLLLRKREAEACVFTSLRPTGD